MSDTIRETISPTISETIISGVGLGGDQVEVFVPSLDFTDLPENELNTQYLHILAI